MYIRPLVYMISATLFITVDAVAEKLPIEAFSVQPAIRTVAVSPDGKRLGVVRATNKKGDYILEIFKTSDLKARPARIGADKMEMTGFSWVNNDRILVNFRQILKDANRKYWVSKSSIVNADASGKWLHLPDRSSIIHFLPDDPKNILISYDNNDNHIPDAVRFNVKTGRMSTLVRGNDKIGGGFISDWRGNVRAASTFDWSSGSIELYARRKDTTDWTKIKTIRPEVRETFEFMNFNPHNDNEIYVLANNGENTAGVYAFDITTKTLSDRQFGLKNLDTSGFYTSPDPKKRGEIIAFSYISKTPKRYYIDAEAGAVFKSIEALFPGRVVTIQSESRDGSRKTIYTYGEKDPGSYYLLTDNAQLQFLGDVNPLLKAESLSGVSYVRFTARDGRKIPAYITKPKGDGPFPAVVMPHGGPWARDNGGFDPWAQLLANRGYIVIQPQFRGSTGYGVDHWAAGDKKWGHEMQDDVDDAALYLVEKGLATRDKLAIFGWSYGGYAAFVGSMRDNNIYQCSVAGAGVSDLKRIRSGLHESPFLREYQRPTIKGLSPLQNVENVNIPILVIHGDIDSIVHVNHSRDFVDGLKKYGKDYKYVELKDSDHYSARMSYDHKLEFYTALTDWLENKCFS